MTILSPHLARCHEQASAVRANLHQPSDRRCTHRPKVVQYLRPRFLSRSVSGLPMVMRGKWLRLVACVSLVAILVAPSHAGMAAARLLTAPPSAGHPSAPAHGEPHPSDGESTCASCCHGAVGHCRAAAAPRDQSRTPCDPDCPHCPRGPFPPKCPCPGGCALCSVAKVPCLFSAPCFASPAPCLGDSVTEPPPPYNAPFSRTLLRPPRA